MLYIWSSISGIGANEKGVSLNRPDSYLEEDSADLTLLGMTLKGY